MGVCEKWSDSGCILKVRSIDLLVDWTWSEEKRRLKDDTRVTGEKLLGCCDSLKWSTCEKSRSGMGRSEVQFWNADLAS